MDPPSTLIRILVLDEADRILDMGFAATLTAILENLPKRRQTLCFSATQTKSVKDLARLSLRDPEYLAVHAESASATPPKLTQLVATCALEKKMEARSVSHWSPYDRVGVVNADP